MPKSGRFAYISPKFAQMNLLLFRVLAGNGEMQVLIAAAGRRDLRGEEKILRHAGAHEKAG